MDKIGLHVLSGFSGSLGRPRVVKLVNPSPEYVRQVQQTVDSGCLIVVRWTESDQPLDDPKRRAQEWFARHKDHMQAMAAANVAFEGYNEVADTAAQAYAAFEQERLRLLHAAGLHAVAGSFSVGTPDFATWPTYQPVLGALTPGDYLGLHEYWSDRNDIQNPYHCGRWRKVPALAQVPIVITECGRDVVEGNGQAGWQKSCSPAEFLEDLQTYHQLIAGCANVAGATVFTGGQAGTGWAAFDVNAIWPQVVAQYHDEEAFLQSLRNAAWNAGGIPFNRDAAFPRFAREHSLGNPETPEFDFSHNGQRYRGQGYSGGIVYAPVGEWDKAAQQDW